MWFERKQTINNKKNKQTNKQTSKQTNEQMKQRNEQMNKETHKKSRSNKEGKWTRGHVSMVLSWGTMCALFIVIFCGVSV